MSDDRTFEVIEAAGKIPSGLSKKVNGFTRLDVVNAFQRAFVMIGGVQRLALWANENPDKFFPLYAKLLPSTSIQLGSPERLEIIHAIGPTELDRHPDRNSQVEGRVRESLDVEPGHAELQRSSEAGDRDLDRETVG